MKLLAARFCKPEAIAVLLLVPALLVVSNYPAFAGETPDPFGTDSMMPPRPALRTENMGGDPCAAQPLDHALNLEEVVNLALCNNPQTHVVWANSLAQAAQVGVSKSAYLPSVSLNAADNQTSGTAPGVNQRSVGVTFSYLLYDFGSRSANLENSHELLVAANATQDSTVQSIFLAAVQDYYQVQATSTALSSALESERAAKESFDAAEARYNAGSATPADKLQAQTAYSQATLNRITADGNLRNAQGTLANILGLDANHDVQLTPANTVAIPNNFEGDISALIEQARQHRPDLQAAAAQVKAAQAGADAARAAGRPTISLSASSTRYNYSGINSNSSLVGINLSVPLFTGYATTYHVRSAEAQLEAKNSQFQQVRLQVALDVWTAYQNLTTATQSLRTSADLLDSAQQSARVALGRYKAGVGSILDVLNAQSALASARLQRIQSTFNWNISRATLAQAMGSLDAGLLQTLSDGNAQSSGKNQPQKIQP
jgi:TolC family type I secretion outer membrane protein